MLVPLEDNVDTVLTEKRLELRPQPFIAASAAEPEEAVAGGERMGLCMATIFQRAVEVDRAASTQASWARSAPPSIFV